MDAFGNTNVVGLNKVFSTSGLENDHRVARLFPTKQINKINHSMTTSNWEHLSNLDQSLSSVSSVNFSDITLTSGTSVNEFSIDGTLAGNSDDAVPTEKAVKTYVDSVASSQDSFLELIDTPAAFTTPNAIYRVNAAGDAIEESATLLLEPLSDRFSLSSGTTAFTVTGDCTINQNLSSGSSVAHAKLFLTSSSEPQLSVRYDISNSLEVSVDSSGNATLNPSGGTLIFNSEKIFMYETSQLAILATGAAPAVTDAGIILWSDDNDPGKAIISRRNTNTTADPPTIKLQKGAGTVTIPTAIASGTLLGLLDYNGYDGAAFNTNIGASIRAQATELWDNVGDVHGTKISLYLNPTAVAGAIQQRCDFSADSSYTYFKLFGTSGGNDTAFKVSPSGDLSIVPSGGDVNITGTLAFTSGTSVNEFSIDGTLAGDSDDVIPTEKAVKSYVDNVENGFLDRADSTLTYNSTLDELTITPAVSSFDLVSNNIKYTISAAETLANAGTQGTYYYYYDGNTLSVTITLGDLFETKALVGIIVLNSAGDLISFGDERHGIEMSWQTHKYLHLTAGTQYSSGIAPSVIIGDGSLDTHAQVASTAGVIFDEDIKLIIDAISMGDTVSLLYRDGASDWLSRESAFYVYKSTDRLYYNSEAAGIYSLTEVSGNNRYTLTHLFATNDVESKRKVIAVMGHAEYQTLGLARDGASTEIQELNIGGLPAIEWIPLATILFQTSSGFVNSVAAKIVQTATGEDYVDWRTATITSSGSAVNHSSLSGLLNDDHPQYTTLVNRGGETLDIDTLQLLNGTSVNELSIDGTLAGDSDDAIPTEKAVKTYVDTKALGDISLTGPSSISTLADDMYLIPAGGNVGINITKGSALTSALEINAVDGECLRLIYNDADGSPTNHTRLQQTSGGNLYIYPSGGDVLVAGSFSLLNGTNVNEFSLDGTLAGNSHNAVPTENSVKTYCDNYISFISLSNAPVSFAQQYSIYRVNSTTNGIEESGVQITTPDVNELKITRGTSYIDVDDTICTINQNLDSGAAVDFAGMTLENTTTPQLSVAYDATKKAEFSVDSAGVLTINPSGNKLVFNSEKVHLVESSQLAVLATGANPAVTEGGIMLWSDDNSPNKAIVCRRTDTNTVSPPVINLEKLNGAIGSPTAIASGTIIGMINFNAHNGVWIPTNIGSSIRATSTELWDNTTDVHGTRLGFLINPTSVTGVIQKRLDLSADASFTHLQIYGGAGANEVDLKVDPSGDLDIVPSGGNVSISGTLALTSGTSVNEFSIDGTLAGDSDDAAPTEKAVKTYVDTLIPTFGATTVGCPAASNPWFVNTNIGYGYQKIGNSVILTVDEYFANSHASGLTYILTGTIPAAIRPSDNIQAYCLVKDDGTDKNGEIQISSAGQIKISIALGGSFTLGVGSTGNYACSVCYSLSTGTTAPV